MFLSQWAMLHEYHGIWDHLQLNYFFNCLLRLTTKETPELHIINPLGGESKVTVYQWVLSHRKHAHVHHIIMVHEVWSHETVELGFERFKSLRHNKNTLIVMGWCKKRHDFSALAMELHLFCINPLMWFVDFQIMFHNDKSSSD